MWAKYRQKRLEKYVRKYFISHSEIKLVAVTGSISKTYTKTAIATLLAERYRVRMFHGNRGLGFVAPLAILGIDYPGDIKGPLAWHKIYLAARRRIKQPADVDVIVHELNSIGPGSLAKYSSYITPDITVITALSESNLGAFGTMDALAQEYISAANISKLALINRDDIDGKYAQFLTTPTITTYGTSAAAEYHFEESDFDIKVGVTGKLIDQNWNQAIECKAQVFDEFSLRQITAAGAVALRLNLSAEEIARGMSKIRPLSGAMNVLDGVENSTLIDATANNSPLAVRESLYTLYRILAPQRIAVFGSMQHLGQLSAAAHQEIGALCDPNHLAWVITVGEEANRNLAPAARGRGCQVKECANAIEAGAFVHSVIEDAATVLFSGPEDGNLFIEEALKIVLHNSSDSTKLVRQSEDWTKKKAEVFSAFRD